MLGRRLRLGIVGALAALGLVTSTAHAQLLYGIGIDNRLYTVDPATAARTQVAPLDREFGSIALDPSDGTLYGYVSPYAITSPNTIRVIDKTTGASQATPFAPNGSFSPSEGSPLMAIPPSAALYALVSPSAGSPTLKFGTIDQRTWVWTAIGNVAAFGGFGFASAPDGTLFAAGADNAPLMTLDRSTGATSTAATLGGDGSSYVASMSIDQTGKIYAVLEKDGLSGSTLSLVSIDRSTGGITSRGDLGPVNLIAFGKPDPAEAPPSGGSDAGTSGLDGADGSNQAAAAQPGPAATQPSQQPESFSLTADRLRAAIGRQLIPTGRRAGIAAMLKARGFSALFRPPAVGALTLEWLYVPRGARLSARPVLVARARKVFTQTSAVRVKVELTAEGRQRLKKSRRIALRSRAVFVTPGGQTVKALNRFSLRR